MVESATNRLQGLFAPWGGGPCVRWGEKKRKQNLSAAFDGPLGWSGLPMLSWEMSLKTTTKSPDSDPAAAERSGSCLTTPARRK